MISNLGKHRRTAVLLLGAFFILSIAGCATFQRSPVTKAVAVLRSNPNYNVTGMVTFVQEGRGVRIIVDAAGFVPGKHGIHIHEFGDISAPDFSSAGGHFNPKNAPHGTPADKERHIGDLGNVEADKSGRIKVSFLDSTISLTGVNSILGRSVIIKEKADDFTTQPSGGAGKRLAAGIIGISLLQGE